MLQVLASMLSASSRPKPQDRPVWNGQVLSVTDTLAPVITTAEEREALAPLTWPRATFPVACDTHRTDADVMLRFPTPLPLGHPVWDEALLDWHLARNARGDAIAGPAMLILDILRGGNMVSGFVARFLASQGIHGFVLHLPQNGRRGVSGAPHDWAAFLPSLRQQSADARRARDVIAALPLIEGPIGIQGTSLGGFVATVAASIDNAFDPVILALTGGDVYGVLTTGQADAARVRQHLHDAGYTDEKLKAELWPTEPLRLAHRLNPNRTWLFTAKSDQVVPPAFGQKLADAIGLDRQHHVPLLGCHYTAALNAPKFLTEMLQAVRTPGGVAEALAKRSA